MTSRWTSYGEVARGDGTYDVPLVIWSATESADLQREMNDVRGNKVALSYDVTLQGRDEKYWLYMARRD